MNLSDAIEGIQAALPDKPRNELTQADMVKALVTFAQQTMGLTNDGIEHLSALATYMLGQGNALLPGEQSPDQQRS